MKASLLFLSIFILCGHRIAAQTGRSLDLARAYEADGDIEKALFIYEDLYRRDSTNQVILERLKNAYKITGKNELRIPVLKRQLAGDSLNVVLWVELADAFFRTKNVRDAEAAVSRALRTNEQSVAVYRAVATMMIENRWFGPVEQIYLKAREKLKNDNLFTVDLASLFTYRGDTYKATREYLRHYQFQSDALDYIRSQILLLPRDDSSYTSVVRALEEVLSVKKEDAAIRRLLIDVHLQQRDYDRAFEQSLIADKIQGKGGLEILSFADVTFQNQLYRIAMKAYRHFLNDYPNTPQAEMGVARCLENMEVGVDSAEGDESTLVDTGMVVQENYFSTKAIESYLTLVGKYKNTEWSSEANYRVGEVYLEKFFDVDRALTYYQQSQKESPASVFRYDVMFRIAECLLIKGNMDLAHRQVQDILREGRTADVIDRGMFVLGELLFFEEDFDSSRAVLGRLAYRREGLFVNDALQYVLLLQEAAKERDGLSSYATALLMARQHKYSEALSRLTALASQVGEASPLLDDVFYQSALLLIRQKRFEEASRILGGVVQNLPQSPLTDLCMKATAEIDELHRKDYPSAISKYREFLVRFPKSIYAVEVRKRLRRLEQIQKKSS